MINKRINKIMMAATALVLAAGSAQALDVRKPDWDAIYFPVDWKTVLQDLTKAIEADSYKCVFESSTYYSMGIWSRDEYSESAIASDLGMTPEILAEEAARHILYRDLILYIARQRLIQGCIYNVFLHEAKAMPIQAGWKR
jgi:hypothetical protein